MKVLRAIDALSERIAEISADSRPADLLVREDKSRISHIAVMDEGVFCGLVGMDELMRCPPGRIFGDLVCKRPSVCIPPEAPLEDVLGLLTDAGRDAAAIIDESGTYLGGLTIDDIQRRRAHEHATRAEMNARLAHFSMENAGESIYWIGPDAEIVYANAAACRSLGYSKKELTGKKLHEINPNFPPDAWSVQWEKSRRLGTHTLETTHLAKDGRVIEVEVVVNFIVHEGREFNCAMVRDITERKRADQEIRRMRDRLDTTMRALPDLLFEVDQSGRILDYRASIPSMLVVPPEKFLGRTFAEILSAEAAQSCFEAIREASRHGFGRGMPYRVMLADGEHWFEPSVGRKDVAGNDGAIFVLLAHDITERRKAEIRLRDSEQRLERVLANIHDALITDDVDGRVTFANSRFFELFAIPLCRRDSIVLEDYIAPEWRDRLRDRHARRIRGEAVPDRFEYQGLRGDGERIWVEVSVVPVIEGERARGTQSVIRDITPRKRAEAALRQSESRLKAIFDSEPECVKLVDADCRILDMNPAGLNMVEADALEQVRGQCVLDLLVPKYRDQYRADVAEVFKGGHVLQSFEIIGLRGSHRWMEQHSVGLRDPDNPAKITQVLAVTRDISTRVRAEQALKNSESRLREAHRLAGLGAWELDLASQTSWWSPEQYRLNGVEPGTPISQSFFLSLIHPADRADFDNAFKRLFSEGETEADYRIIRPDGEIRRMHGVASLISDDNGRPVRICGTNQDVTERARIEEVLRENEKRLKDTQRIAKVGSLDWNLLTNEMIVSDEIMTMYGLDRARGNPTVDELVEILHPDDRKRVLASLRDAAAGIARHDMEHRILRPDGKLVYVRATAELFLDSVGKPVRLLGTVIDITERKRAEEKQRVVDARLDVVMENISDGFFLLDRNWRYLEINETGARMVGHSREELIGRHYLEVFPEAAGSVWETTYARVMESGEAEVVEDYYAPLKQWFEARVSQFDGGVSVFFADITQRKRAEKAVLESTARLLESNRIARIGNWELDIPSNQLIWSDTIFDIFEIEKRNFNVTYKGFLDVVHPDDRELVDATYRLSLSNKTPYEITHRLLMSDGRIKFVNERCETFYDAHGLPLRSIGTVQDVTEHTRIEAERARAAQRELVATLAGGLAHEFNSMLLAASAFLQIPGPGMTRDENHEKALFIVEHAQALSASLLELFAGQEGDAVPILAVNEWLPDRLHTLSKLVPPNVQFRYALSAEPFWGRAAPLAFEQVLRILLTNASDALPDGGEVLIASALVNSPEKNQRCLEIRILDQGTGIAKADRERIFDPFFTTRKRSRRSGLGLAIARRLVDQFGGTLSYEPNQPRGSVFIIRLVSADKETK